MKNKVQIILIILCIIFLNSVYMTCAFKDSGNARVEMILTTKVSPAIKTPSWIFHRFFYDEPYNHLLKNDKEIHNRALIIGVFFLSPGRQIE